MEGTIRPEKGGKRNHLPPGTKMNQVRTQQNHPQNTPKKNMFDIVEHHQHHGKHCFHMFLHKQTKKTKEKEATYNHSAGGSGLFRIPFFRMVTWVGLVPKRGSGCSL
jgi:rubredoxin